METYAAENFCVAEGGEERESGGDFGERKCVREREREKEIGG